MPCRLWSRVIILIFLFCCALGMTHWWHWLGRTCLRAIPTETVEDLEIPGSRETDADILPDTALNPATLQPLFNDEGRLIGGTSDGRWHAPEDFIPYLTAMRQFQVYSPTRRLGEAWGSLNERRVVDETGDYRLELSRPQSSLPPDTAFLILGDWNPFPRTPVYIAENHKKYHPLMEKILAEMGLEAPISVDQAIQVDLDGDGLDELLLSASYFPDDRDHSGPGIESAYSIIVLYQKNLNDDRGIILYGACREATRYAIRFVADVTGDWGMEFLVRETRRLNSGIFQKRDILMKLEGKTPRKIGEIHWRPDPAEENIYTIFPSLKNNQLDWREEKLCQNE